MKALLIHNPAAGPWDVRRALKRIRSQLGRRGWSVDFKQTMGSGDAKTMAQSAAQAGYGTVIVAGGDGTVNEVVNGLVGTQTAMGVLPVGTGNLWAKQLRIAINTVTNPLRHHEAVDNLTKATVRSIDVGQINDQYFLCWAGIGLDAKVTTEMEPRPRHAKHLGALSYIVAALMIARDFKGVRSRVYLDGHVVRGRTILILVSNIQQYGGLLHVSQQARIDDGLLDVFVFKGLGFSYALRHTMTMLSRRCLQDPKIVHRQARHIQVLTQWAIPAQVDGDSIGTTPVTLNVVPQALRVLVPPSAPRELFTL